ncbi:MAG: ROK family glucokinase [Pseudobutyrivibrio sp.]|nr:ROK family glucokinase [Pseudobutyrivibrio sp.]
MKEYGFGLDLGGTTCKVGLFKTDGTLLEKWEVPTDTSDNGSKILKNLADSVLAKIAEKGLDAKSDIEGVGIGVPGPATDDGIVHKCVNLGWGVKPVGQELEHLLGGIKVKVGNDANVAALGEAWMGAAKSLNSCVMVTLGTGVGGGVVMNGKVVAGATGAGGEIGHILINPKETRTCGCGLHGCLEQYASATGIAYLGRTRLEKDNTPSALRDVENLEARHIFDAAKEGDALAIEVVEEACTYLAQGLSAISCVVNPDAFVIGGGVSKAGEYLTEQIKKRFVKVAFHSCCDTQIMLATLGNDAGMYGSMKLIL